MMKTVQDDRLKAAGRQPTGKEWFAEEGTGYAVRYINSSEPKAVHFRELESDSWP